MIEEWKDVKGYEGLYMISNLGRIKSLQGCKYRKQERILKQYKKTGGYYQVSLSKNHKSKWFTVHRLVAINFIDNPNNYPQINHIDENKSNNSASNLEWCTAKYNNNYGSLPEKRSIIAKEFKRERNELGQYI